MKNIIWALTAILFIIIIYSFSLSKKLSNNTLHIGEEKIISYRYDGSYSNRKIIRYIKIKAKPTIVKDGAYYKIRLYIKDMSSDPFFMIGRQIFLINTNNNIISNLADHNYYGWITGTGYRDNGEIVIEPGQDGGVMNIYIDSSIMNRLKRIDFKKRFKGNLFTAFSIDLKSNDK